MELKSKNNDLRQQIDELNAERRKHHQFTRKLEEKNSEMAQTIRDFEYYNFINLNEVQALEENIVTIQNGEK